MRLGNISFNTEYADARSVLLYRFHIVVIAVYLLAAAIDLWMGRSSNLWIDSIATILLILNIGRLRRGGNTQFAAYAFFLILAVALFLQIWFSHFGTMSVVFVLLLPLTIMFFIPLRQSLLIELVMVAVMTAMLYLEYLNNPSNPLFQSPKALFHLGYTALIIYIFGILYHSSIRRTVQELDESNHQKELLLKEVHHRVKNNLNVIASIIGLQAASLNKEEQEHLLKSKARIESIAMVHEMLYRADDLTGVDFSSYMQKLSNLLLNMYGQRQKISVEIKSNTPALPLDIMIQLGIMANEMLTNSIKYAFGDKKSGATIVMALNKDDSGYHFLYKDNGTGAKNTNSLLESRSLGIKLIQLTVKQLGGTLDLSSYEGLQYDIRFSR